MTSSTVHTHPFRILFLFVVAVSFCRAGIAAGTPQAAKPAKSGPKSDVVKAMEDELDRSVTGFAKAEPPPYFISYSVSEQQRAEVQGSNGALLSSQETHNRWLQASVRVGGYDLDNTRKVGGTEPGYETSYGASAP